MHRVVFKLRDNYKKSEDYWIENYPVSEISSKSFVQPLEAIGIIYTSQSVGISHNKKERKVFVPCNINTLNKPIPDSVLIYSGIGPRKLLEELGIPCLYNTQIN